MEHNEEPFESLTRGLDKDLTPLFGTSVSASSRRNFLIAVDPVFARTGLSNAIPPQREVLAHATQTLTDRFAQQIAVFPLSHQIVVNEFGVFIPKALLRNRSHFEYNDEQTSVRVSVETDRSTGNGLEQLKLQATKTWADISKNDAVYDIGRNPITLDITDASENLDRYLYGGE